MRYLIGLVLLALCVAARGQAQGGFGGGGFGGGGAFGSFGPGPTVISVDLKIKTIQIRVAYIDVSHLPPGMNPPPTAQPQMVAIMDRAHTGDAFVGVPDEAFTAPHGMLLGVGLYRDQPVSFRVDIWQKPQDPLHSTLRFILRYANGKEARRWNFTCDQSAGLVMVAPSFP